MALPISGPPYKCAEQLTMLAEPNFVLLLSHVPLTR